MAYWVRLLICMQEICSSNSPVVTEICDPNKSQVRHHHSKMILLNILQNGAIYLFKYFVVHTMIISGNDTFLYYKTNQISSRCMILRNALLTLE